eukprot:CAMPEP_0179075094 /NCGR_PEP_ID=MMETSP0796-20121207/33418_1 /TAXON_ID=73915 /ORGANISM="Pyrodinium bahamense, Strain pbaha01" /LENGTH=356 /DNA_ID=CAMNT_0020772325 /DNA_START=36 /DNA_END=1106 /DNA_ORIENTATION=+
MARRRGEMRDERLPARVGVPYDDLVPTEYERRSCAGMGPRIRAMRIQQARQDPMVVRGDKLTDACKSNDSALVQSLLHQQADPNHIHPYVESRVPIMCTSEPAVVKVLVEHRGADVNASDLNHLTVLGNILLHHRDRPDLLAALLAHPDLDVHKGDALSTAARFASPEVLEVLLADPRVDIADQQAGFLHYALARTDSRALDVVRMLLQHRGLDINLCLVGGKRMPKSTGSTPLHFVSQRDSITIEIGENEKDKLTSIAARQVEMLGLLLSRPDIELNTQDGQGATPLHKAAIAGRADIVRSLVADGRCEASRAIRDADGRTPLECAVFEGQKERPRWEPLPCTADHAAVVAILSK